MPTLGQKQNKQEKVAEGSEGILATDAEEGGEEDLIYLGDNPELEVIVDHLQILFGFDENEKETVKLQIKNAGVSVPRLLGNFVKINVYAASETVRCSCEKCNFDGHCFWVNTFESLQFGAVPETRFMTSDDATRGWDKRVAQAITVLKYNHLNMKQ